MRVLVGVYRYMCVCVLVFFFRPYHIPYRHVYNASNFVCVHALGLLLYARIYIFLLCLSLYFFYYSRNLVCAFFFTCFGCLAFDMLVCICWFQHQNRSKNTHLCTTTGIQSLKRIYAWNKLRWCYFIFKWKCDVRFLSKEIQS